MTTTVRPDEGLAPPGRPGVGPAAPRVLAAAVSCVVVTVLLTAGAGALLDGRSAAAGGLVGGGMAAAFFLFGSATVAAATRLAPQVALVVAMSTYLLQVVAVLAVFAALTSAGLVGDTLAAGWLAAGVIAATVVWTVAQMVFTARARIPLYDLGTPRQVGAS